MNGIKIHNKYFSFLRSALTVGGRSQEFLGATWILFVLKIIPTKNFALRLISLSPHYFYGKRFFLSSGECKSEALRNDLSREKIMQDILIPHMQQNMIALDYGCGPGFLAKHVSKNLSHVYAVDISDGILACAEIINPSAKIQYQNINSTDRLIAICNIAYSFAVFQHLTLEVARQAARFIYSSLLPGGKAIIHVVINAEGWEEEKEVFKVTDKIKRKYGLNCFSRSHDDYLELFRSEGFDSIKIEPASNFTNVVDDIQSQHILIASKRI